MHRRVGDWSGGMLNRNSPIPLYFQLMQEIREQIDSGVLKPGDAIPTELDLMRRYDISRATVRQSILQLVQEGYLRRIRAKGTFVNTLPEKPKFIGTLRGFAQEMKQRGVPCRTRVLDKGIVSAPVKVAEKLHVPAESRVFFLHRLRYIHDEPVLLAGSYIPESLCRNIESIDFEENSLYDVLENRYDIRLHHGRRDFEPAIPSSATEMELLHLTPKTPILYVESVVYTKEGRPVEYVEIRMRGRFSVDLIQRGNAQ
jgi:GntR family transcriptional regulator